MTGILRRFPTISAILPVYAVIAVPIFGWTITSWLWKLPSWLNFLTPGEIAAIFFYAILTAFVESILICSFLLLLCFILPSQMFRDQFVVRGTWIAIGLALSILGNGGWRGMTRFTYAEVSLTFWSIASLILIILLTLISTKVHFMTYVADWISDRLIIFLYILIPLSILSILVVVFRNTLSG
jgi:hypothetical protein